MLDHVASRNAYPPTFAVIQITAHWAHQRGTNESKFALVFGVSWQKMGSHLQFGAEIILVGYLKQFVLVGFTVPFFIKQQVL